jgi:hypothetical protein
VTDTGGHHPVDRYIAAWTTDPTSLAEVLANDVVFETNLGQADRFLATLRRLADEAVIRVSHRVDGTGRSMVVYDCTARDGGRTARVVEYLDVEDGRITSVRRVYDVVGFRAALPGLAEVDGPG